MRVLIHPGFHKTGTSSLQRAALASAEALEPRLRVLLTDHLRPATQIARRYAIHHRVKALDDFGAAFADHISGLDPADPRPVLISSEALIGQIPGRKGVWTYAAALPLLMAAVEVLHRHAGTSRADITVWFTTRAAEDWKRSAYWQNLRSERLTEAFDSYQAKLDRGARMDDVVAEVRAALDGQAQVLSDRIERIGSPSLGPLGAALDLLDLPADGLAPQPFHNVQPAGAAEELLALNRSALDDEALAEAKSMFMKSLWRAGLTQQEAK